MRFPYLVKDQFQLTFPPSMMLEGLPKSGELPFATSADYMTKFVSKGNVFWYGRLIRVGKIGYWASEYPSLRSFFQAISSRDHSQIALEMVPAAVTNNSGGGK